MSKPCLPMHPDYNPDCPICWRAKHSKPHQRIWGIPETGEEVTAVPRFKSQAAPVTVSLPCIHLGSPVRGEAAPDTTRDYRKCDHPDKPLGAVVCSCRGCGPKCSGYSV